VQVGVFEKGYTRTYSKEVHTITSIQGNNYTLDNGQTYRTNRLQKVSKVDETPEKAVEPENEVVEKVPLNEEDMTLRDIGFQIGCTKGRITFEVILRSL